MHRIVRRRPRRRCPLVSFGYRRVWWRMCIDRHGRIMRRPLGVKLGICACRARGVVVVSSWRIFWRITHRRRARKVETGRRRQLWRGKGRTTRAFGNGLSLGACVIALRTTGNSARRMVKYRRGQFVFSWVCQSHVTIAFSGRLTLLVPRRYGLNEAGDGREDGPVFPRFSHRCVGKEGRRRRERAM